MPKISGRNIAKNNTNNQAMDGANQTKMGGFGAKSQAKRKQKEAPNPIDEDIFVNAKQTLKNAQKDNSNFRNEPINKNMMKTNFRWQADPNSQPPPNRKVIDGKPK